MEEGWPTRSSNNRAPQSAHTSVGASSIAVTACRVRVPSFPAAGVQAALLTDVGAAGRLRVAPCAAPCKCPMLDHGSFRIFGPVQAKASLTKEVTIYRVDGET